MAKKKIGVICSAGGARCARQVGGLKYLFEKYDIRIIGGTSAGAINASIAVQNQGTDELEYFWSNSMKDRGSIYKHWRIPLIPSFWKTGVFNSSPLRNIIRSQVDEDKIISSPIQFLCNSVNLNTGQVMYTENVPESRGRLANQIIASSAHPFLFESMYARKHHYMDGGLWELAPITPTITRGPKRIDTYVVLLSSGVSVEHMEKLPVGAVRMGLRGIDITFKRIMQSDIFEAQALYPKKNIILSFPDPQIIVDPMGFDYKMHREAIQEGYERTKQIMEEGETL